MGKRIVPFGTSPTDLVVMAWLERKGIDPAEVMDYKIHRSAQGTPTLTLELFYDESPPMAEVTGLNQVEPSYLSTDPGHRTEEKE